MRFGQKSQGEDELDEIWMRGKVVYVRRQTSQSGFVFGQIYQSEATRGELLDADR